MPAPPDGLGLLVIGPVTLQFERSMDGEFTLELSGDWKLVNDLGTQGCDGPWTARFTP